MSLTAFIDDRAATEIAETFDWYLGKTDLAAANFKNEIAETFDLLKQDIIVYQESFRKLRRCPLKFFPTTFIIKKRRTKK